MFQDRAKNKLNKLILLSKMKKYYLFLLVFYLKINSFFLSDCIYSMKFALDFGLKYELFDAIENGDRDKVQLIIRRNRNHAHISNSFGQNPLYRAVNNQNLSLVKLLLVHGARSHILTDNGDTALHLATKNRLTEIVTHLLAGNSAFKYTRDNQGLIALDYAKYNGFSFLAKMLKINNWQQINPELFIQKNKKFFEIADDALDNNYLFTDDDEVIDDFAKKCILDNYPEQLGNFEYITFELKKFIQDKRSEDILCASKKSLKNYIESLFSSEVAHKIFPARFTYCDLVSASGNYSRPYPVIAESAFKFKSHPITKTPITHKLALISSFKYWQAKKLPLTDFNNTLKEGDPISFEEFEIPIEHAQQFAMLQNLALPDDLLEHGSNGFLPSSTFVNLLNVKKTE
jgi:ankyrin repeat protein